jgi:hypothetical protein
MGAAVPLPEEANVNLTLQSRPIVYVPEVVMDCSDPFETCQILAVNPPSGFNCTDPNVENGLNTAEALVDALVR